MDIPNSILEKLRCNLCKNYLSCGPIYCNYKTSKVSCGRCNSKKPSPTATIIRYWHYETIASMLLFPCKFTKHGCTKKLQFSQDGMQKHELTCMFKKRVCPMASSKTEPQLKCKWIGSLTHLLHHFKLTHPNNILLNPSQFQHDFTQPMYDTYLIPTFNLLFILIITITDELIYNVRLLGDDSKVSAYKFTLKISSKHPNTNKLNKDCIIINENETITKDNSLVLNITSLTEVFESASGANFKLTIQQTPEMKCRQCKYCLNETIEERNACVSCHKKFIYCRYNKNGCTFADISPEKCKKHEEYFCKYLNECPDCNSNVEKNTLFQHYILNHGAFRANIGKTWHINEGYKQYCILLSDDGIFLCKLSLACYRLLLTIFSPFSTDELKDFCCEIEIKDPGNCYKHKIVPKNEFTCCYDWNININMYNYPMWKNYGLDLCVVIKKNNM